MPVTQTTLIPFLEVDEKMVDGKTMLKRSRQKGAMAGIRQALHDNAHTEEIPAEEREMVRLYTGTILRHRDRGDRGVLFLYSGVDWYLSFCLLGLDFYSGYCVGRRAHE